MAQLHLEGFDHTDINVKIVDDFFDDPDRVRRIALRQKYYLPKMHPSVTEDRRLPATHPGKRTRRLNSICSDIYQLSFDGFNEKFQMPGWWYHSMFFQSTREKDGPSWVHRDGDLIDKYVMMCFLTPNPPKEGGTLFYDTFGKNANVIKTIDNKYNRAFVYDGRYYHKSNLYFGDTLKNGRLFLIDFIDKHGEV